MNNDNYIDSDSIVSALNLVDTNDIPTQLVNINYRLDIIITIAIYLLVGICVVGVSYLLYRFLIKFF